MFVKALRMSDVPTGSVVGVLHGEDVIAFANVEGRFYAFSSECTHSAGWLHEGILEGCIISCPMHWGAYDVRTGQAVELPASLPVQTYVVRTVDGDVEIDLPGLAG